MTISDSVGAILLSSVYLDPISILQLKSTCHLLSKSEEMQKIFESAVLRRVKILGSTEWLNIGRVAALTIPATIVAIIKQNFFYKDPFSFSLMLMPHLINENPYSIQELENLISPGNDGQGFEQEELVIKPYWVLFSHDLKLRQKSSDVVSTLEKLSLICLNVKQCELPAPVKIHSSKRYSLDRVQDLFDRHVNREVILDYKNQWVDFVRVLELASAL